MAKDALRIAERLAAETVERHPFHVAIAAYVGGLALTELSLETVALIAAALAVATARAGSARLGPVLAALLVAGAVVGAARLESLAAERHRLGAGDFIDDSATMLTRPRASRFGSSAEVEITSGELSGLRLVARAAGDMRWPPSADPGRELHVVGSARPARSSAGSEFDYPAHLRRRGIAGELHLDSVAATGRRRGGVGGTVDGMRERAERALAAGTSPEHFELIAGMVLGQDERIDSIVRDDFRRSGLAHLLAVSGQNVMLLAVLAVPLLAALGLGPRARVAGLLALIAVYVPLAGAGPSLQRAAVMGAAGLLAIAFDRPASRSYALLLAAATTLTLNPLAGGDAGWQLSFAAVVGILVLGGMLRRPLGGLPRVLAEGVAVTIAATLATAPLLAHHFGSVSIAALPANLLALPIVAPVMWIGMLQVGLGQAMALGGPLASAASVAATALGAIGDALLACLAGLAQRFAELPGAELRLALRSPIEIAGAYGALGVAVIGLRRLAHRIGPTATAEAGRWRTEPPWRRRAAVAALGVGVLVGAGAIARPPPPPERLTVRFLDVGQGDATLVQHPDGGAVLFDGGPAEARVARLVRAAGVRRLSAVVATHASADHHGGLPEVIDRIPVDVLVDGGDGAADPGFDAVLATAERRGVRRVAAAAGQTLRAGGLVVRILSPEPRPPGPAPEDPNPRAVVALVSAGDFDLFLSADAESPSLLPLSLPDVEAMKVPHHGSSDPGLPEVLARLRPQVAAIEVGENSYGHPAPSTVAALRQAGVATYRTDLQGTVALTVADGALRIGTER